MKAAQSRVQQLRGEGPVPELCGCQPAWSVHPLGQQEQRVCRAGVVLTKSAPGALPRRRLRAASWCSLRMWTRWMRCAPCTAWTRRPRWWSSSGGPGRGARPAHVVGTPRGRQAQPGLAPDQQRSLPHPSNPNYPPHFWLPYALQQDLHHRRDNAQRPHCPCLADREAGRRCCGQAHDCGQVRWAQLRGLSAHTSDACVSRHSPFARRAARGVW